MKVRIRVENLETGEIHNETIEWVTKDERTV
jgi:hypothetical protein